MSLIVEQWRVRRGKVNACWDCIINLPGGEDENDKREAVFHPLAMCRTRAVKKQQKGPTACS